MSSEKSNLSNNTIRLKRAYEPVASDDGLRVLVDRLWARGISKEDAHLNAWMRELRPSKELREWFGHRPERWSGFQERYQQELLAPLRQLFLDLLQSAAHVSVVTLIYGARDTQRNEAVVLRDYLLAQSTARLTAPDGTLIPLATVTAVAAAKPSGTAQSSALIPFVGSFFSAPQLEATLETLRDDGELREGQDGWQLTFRGERLLREVPSLRAV